MNNDYIITGPGRTGSHWLEQIMVRVLDLDRPVIHRTIPQRILHTHELDNILNNPSGHTQKRLIVSRRRCNFSSVISYFVAQYTTEWGGYSKKEFAPLYIDPHKFIGNVNGINQWYYKLDTKVMPLFAYSVNIWYEDLVAETDPEKYVASILDIPYLESRRNHPADLGKNPRDYSKLVVNYQELREIYLQNQ